MADQIPDGSPEMTPAQARAAKAREGAVKARAARAAKQAELSATERVLAPDTVAPDPEKEELLRKLAEAEENEKLLVAQLEKATQPPPIAPQIPTPVPAYVSPLPRNMRVERSGNTSAQYSTRWPQIRGGTCEFCGVLDQNTPAQFQYKLCPHFRGMTARCTYCPENKDPDEVVYHQNLNVATHPDDSNTIIMWCNLSACSEAHLKRFNRALSF